MRVIKQQTISIHAISFVVACTDTGRRYLSISAICKALMIDRPTQVRRIKNSEVSQHLCQLILQLYPGGEQKVYCLPVESVPVWLSGLQSNTVKPAYRDVLQALRHDLLDTVDAACAESVPLALPALQEEVPREIQGPVNAQVEEEDPTLVVEQILHAYQPQTKDSSPLIIPLLYHEQHTAFREASVARQDRWIKDEESKEDPSFHSTSTQLQVFVSRPSKPVGLVAAMQRIAELGPSTVLAARLSFLFWNARRHLPPPYAQDGWVAIQVEEFLLLRNLQMHSRAVSDTEARITDGTFETKYIDRLQSDLELLNETYMRKWLTVDNYFDSPYLRVILLMERSRRSKSKDRLVKVAVRPGEWMPVAAPKAFDCFTGIDERLVQFNLKTDIHALLIGLFLTERWRQQALQSMLQSTHLHAMPVDSLDPYREPITIQELLDASVIAIDKTNLTSRFAPRIEEAFQKLFEYKILAEPVKYLTSIDRSRNWGQAWLDAPVLLLPKIETEEEIKQRLLAAEKFYQLSLFDDGTNENAGFPFPSHRQRRLPSPRHE